MKPRSTHSYDANVDQSSFHGVGAEYDQKYKEWWERRRQNQVPPRPAEFLMSFGIPSDVMQLMFWETLYSGCKDYSKGPGHVNYLVQKLFFTEDGKAEAEMFLPTEGEGESDDDEHDDDDDEHELTATNKKYDQMLGQIISMGSKTDQIAEQDIFALVDLFAVAFENKPPQRRLAIWTDVTRNCLRHTYGSEFLQQIFDRIPHLHSEEDLFSIHGLKLGEKQEYRQALDIDCVLGIQRLLTKLEEIDINETKWMQSAFKKFLEVLAQTSELTTLNMVVPNHLVEDDPNPSDPSDHMSEVGSSIAGDMKVGGLDDLRVWFDYKKTTEPMNGGAIPMLKILPRMISLKSILVDLKHFPFEEAAPYIIQTILNARLLREILLKVENPSQDISYVLDTFDALKELPCITEFHFLEDGLKNGSHRMGSMEEKFLDVLEVNTSLRAVKLGQHYPCHSRYSLSNKRSGYLERIRYFLDLNEQGRDLARKSTTTLEIFVGLVTNAAELDTTDEHSFNVQYGLLRESPGLWCVCDPPPAQKRKRKRQTSCS